MAAGDATAQDEEDHRMLDSKEHLVVYSAGSSELESSDDRSGCIGCRGLASVHSLPASHCTMARDVEPGAAGAGEGDSELQSCASNIGSYSRRMQQVGERVFLEELLAELGATISSIKVSAICCTLSLMRGLAKLSSCCNGKGVFRRGTGCLSSAPDSAEVKVIDRSS